MKCIFIFIAALLFSGSMVYGNDMRTLQIEAREKEQALAEKAVLDHQAAEEEAGKKLEQISKDRSTLDSSIASLKKENRSIKETLDRLTLEITGLQEQEKALTIKLSETDSVVRELVGVIRINAKDIKELVIENPKCAIHKPSIEFLDKMADQSMFPGMTEIRRMVDMVFDQIMISGEVTVTPGTIVDRAGRETEADILSTGAFSSAYRHDNEFGFLTYSSSGQKLYALSRLPSGRMTRQLKKYMKGENDAVPVDVSRGAALMQFTNKPDLWQQISRGGPLVWPILLIFLTGMAITAERTIFILKRRFNGDSLISQIDLLASYNDWKTCISVCDKSDRKPVARVIRTGLSCFKATRQEMEDTLQEAILKEIPSMERFLSTLGMLAAIAPLLGLLGTVTGMIDTFQVITMHGTGDARMMSGGISVALVTTMLGLSVAIPIMLAHTLIGRAVDNEIGQMEEKAIALVNIFHKNREEDD